MFAITVFYSYYSKKYVDYCLIAINIILTKFGSDFQDHKNNTEYGIYIFQKLKISITVIWKAYVIPLP